MNNKTQMERKIAQIFISMEIDGSHSIVNVNCIIELLELEQSYILPVLKEKY